MSWLNKYEKEAKMLLQNKVVVVTGGTGSLGKVLVRRILSGELGVPKKVVVFSRDEGKQHEMRQAYLCKKFTTDEVIYNNFINVLQFHIGDIKNYQDVCSVLKDAQIVINAAALKQVPTCEYFPYQAVLTNCLGAHNIIHSIHEHNYPVEVVVAISTDKAAKPVNIMGMTKAIQERIFTSANLFLPDVRFICVRYGNVLASRGSVIPMFHNQLRNGLALTVTDPEMTRFLLSINQAVDTIFAALKDAKRGETFIPNAPSATIYNIAKALIGDRNIDIEIIGIRPGEKIHEILISEEEYQHTVKRGDYYAISSILPELRNKEEKKSLILNKELSSADNVLSLADTVALLVRHSLLEIDARDVAEENFLI
jgi:FlaA1/EpsC-like NDP-sugar epimerase